MGKKVVNRVIPEIWGFKELEKPQTVGSKIEITLNDKDLPTQAWISPDCCYKVKENGIEQGGKNQFELDDYF